MLDVGKTLRGKRQELNKSLEDIHDEIRISVQHIAYLEENNFTFLPATYVKSFLKTYATCLGLDSGALLEAYIGRDDAPPQVQEEAQSKPKAKPPARPEEKAPVKTEAATEPDLEAAFERDRAIEPAVARPPAKKTSRRARGSTDRPSEARERPFLEWSLALGFCLLLILVTFAYVQLRSLSLARSADRPRFEAVRQPTSLADVSLREVPLSDSSAVMPLLQLKVRALTDLTIELNIDDQKKVTRRAVARQSLVWNARNRFELKLSEVSRDGADSASAEDSANVVTLDFSRNRADSRDAEVNPEKEQ